MVAVAEDGVPLVDLLHHLQVQTVLLQRAEEPDVSTMVMIYTINIMLTFYLRVG